MDRRIFDMKLIAALTLGLLVAGCDDAYAAENYDPSKGSDTFGMIKIAATSVVKAANGMSLYTFDNDAPNRSNCNGDCAESWPPYAASAGTKASGKGMSIIERKDGSLQWAKDGAPLYFWVGDSEPGDTTGDGVGGVWHIAR
jgi:predicted lipoprotein with Yx(FWY)xxD motif